MVSQDGDALELVLPVSARGKLEGGLVAAALALLGWVLWSSGGGLDLFDGLLGLALFVLGGLQSYHRVAEDRLRLSPGVWRLERRLLGVIPFTSATNAEDPSRTLNIDPEAREWVVDGERFGHLSSAIPLRAHELVAQHIASAPRALPGVETPLTLPEDRS